LGELWKKKTPSPKRKKCENCYKFEALNRHPSNILKTKKSHSQGRGEGVRRGEGVMELCRRVVEGEY